MNTQIDKYGYVVDLELAKDILIEYFSSGQFKYWNELEGLRNKIRNNLIKYEGGYSFKGETGIYFGGPDGMSGYIIRELNDWLKNNNPPSVDGKVRDLNNEEKVFFEIDGELKCFILHESD
mgnify:CR=1 FL=1|jgi:hypothetical protein